MKLLRTVTMITALASATYAYADNKAPAPAPAAPAKAPDKAAPAKDAPKAEEISQADAEKFLAFFNKLVDAVVANKDDCTKMATGVNGVIDSNKDMIAKANEAKAAGKKLPKSLEDKMMARVKEMMPAMQKCQNDKAVQAAFMRMDGGGKDTKTDTKTATPPPAKK
jgi:hypothetical protein